MAQRPALEVIEFPIFGSQVCLMRKESGQSTT
jgi:hypothetical protein